MNNQSFNGKCRFYLRPVYMKNVNFQIKNNFDSFTSSQSRTNFTSYQKLCKFYQFWQFWHISPSVNSFANFFYLSTAENLKSFRILTTLKSCLSLAKVDMAGQCIWRIKSGQGFIYWDPEWKEFHCLVIYWQ